MPSIQQRSVLYSQNFLKNPCLIDQLLNRYNLMPEDTIYEIGPGKGIIIERLAQRCRQVIAIEKDPCLVELLHRRFAHVPNITIHEGDFLQFRLPISHYKVFASIPFNITTAIVTRLTTTPVWKGCGREPVRSPICILSLLAQSVTGAVIGCC